MFETSIKIDNKYIFVGWSNKINEEFAIAKKETSKFIYVTNKYLNGIIEKYRYRK